MRHVSRCWPGALGGWTAQIYAWVTTGSSTSRSGVLKINVAMSELPHFTANLGTDLQDHYTGSVELCLSRESAERALQDAHLGHRAAIGSFVDGGIPTTIDPDLAPKGVQVFSMFSQWVPHEWSEEPHREEPRPTDRAIDGYTALAPNVMEQELGLIGGNIFHGELTVDQLFHMRPSPGFADYRTPNPASTTGRAPPTPAAGQRHPRLASVPCGKGGSAARETWFASLRQRCARQHRFLDPGVSS